ncbi:MAG TPA: amidohydrolase family protein, partial [Rhodothermales bacterium]|nr:amidohydrolase family protein [Rhodothermales bacterium]
TIRGAGRTVYAGFIDGMARYGVPADSAWANGGATPDPGDPPRARAGLTPERDVRALFDPAADEVEAWRNQGFTAAHVVPRGGVLPGMGALALLRPPGRGEGPGGVFLPDYRTLVAAMRPARGVYPTTVMGVTALLRQWFAEAERQDAVVRRFGRDGSGERPTVDPALDALAAGLDGRPFVFEAARSLDARLAIDLAEAHDLDLVLAVQPDPLLPLARLREAGVPVLVPLALPDTVSADTTLRLPDLPPPGEGTTFVNALRTFTPEDVDDERAVLTQGRRGALRTLESGPVRLAAAEIPFGFASLDAKPDDARAALRRMVAAGLSADDALAALTTTPARMLGAERLLGTVEPGRLANLVITDGDYFARDTHVRDVIVEGVRYTVDLDEKPGGGGAAAGGAGATSQAGADSTAATNTAAVPAPPVLRRTAGLRTVSDLPSADTRGDLLIRGATVHTVTDGTLEDTDVLVRDGRIRAVGQGLDAPSGVRVIEAAGLHLTPGIVDAHSHMALRDINEAANPNVAEVMMRDAVDPSDLALYHALAGGVTIINAMHGSANPIGGQNATLKLRWGATDADELIMEGAPQTIKFALGENPTRVHGRGRGIRPGTRMGVEWTFREAFEDARRYREATEQARRDGDPPPPVNGRLESLAHVLDGTTIPQIHSYRADEILMMIRVLRDYGVTRYTFQHVNEGFKVAPEIAAAGAGASVFSDWWAYKIEVYYSTAYNAAILTRNGVRASINSDDDELTRHLYHEAAKAQRYGGLSDDEALALITINPAWQLGIDDRVGSIEVGKDADLVLFSAPPLSIYAVPQMTIVDGVVRFDRAGDTDDMRIVLNPAEEVIEIRAAHSEDACLRGALEF